MGGTKGLVERHKNRMEIIVVDTGLRRASGGQKASWGIRTNNGQKKRRDPNDGHSPLPAATVQALASWRMASAIFSARA